MVVSVARAVAVVRNFNLQKHMVLSVARAIAVVRKSSVLKLVILLLMLKCFSFPACQCNFQDNGISTISTSSNVKKK